jgi:hypothetical protein
MAAGKKSRRIAHYSEFRKCRPSPNFNGGGTRMIKIIGILLVSMSVAAQSPAVRRITLDEAQAQAVGTKMAHLARLGVEAAKYHRQAIQADYFPKISADFVNLHFNSHGPKDSID